MADHAPRFVEKLRTENVPIGDVFLDPNNPRLLTGDRVPVPDHRIVEGEVQRRTLGLLEDGPFDMGRMRASIERSGLLPIDRIVVRPIEGHEGRYVVVEGNRRIGGVKAVVEADRVGETTLSEDIRASLMTPAVLILENHDEHSARADQWVIQGIRHVSGIKPWGAYQVAKTIEAMTGELGYTPEQAADALTIPVGRVRRALRVLSALRQMAEDDEYGDQVKPTMFGYFDEAIRSVKVRDWLGWNQTTGTFEDDDHRSQFYSWIADDDAYDENPEHQRIPSPEGVRKLKQVLDSDDAIELLNTPGSDIDAVAASLDLEQEPEWRPPLRRALTALEAIPIGTLEELSDDDTRLIRDLLELTTKRLAQAAALSARPDSA